MFFPKYAQSWGVYYREDIQLRETTEDFLVANVYISCDERAETSFFRSEDFRNYRQGSHYGILLGLDMGTNSVVSGCPPVPLSVSSSHFPRYGAMGVKIVYAGL